MMQEQFHFFHWLETGIRRREQAGRRRLAASASFATQAGPICGGGQLQSKQRNGGPFNDNKHVSEENTSGSFHDLGVLDLRP
jgi:hypothetical protein